MSNTNNLGLEDYVAVYTVDENVDNVFSVVKDFRNFGAMGKVYEVDVEGTDVNGVKSRRRYAGELQYYDETDINPPDIMNLLYEWKDINEEEDFIVSLESIDNESGIDFCQFVLSENPFINFGLLDTGLSDDSVAYEIARVHVPIFNSNVYEASIDTSLWNEQYRRDNVLRNPVMYLHYRAVDNSGNHQTGSEILDYPS